MKFVRIAIHRESGQVLSVRASEVIDDIPPVVPDAEQYEVFDVGCVMDGAWLQASVFHSLVERHAAAGSHPDAPRWRLKPDALERFGAKIYFCPCTRAGIRAHLRARGQAGLPAVVRAWLLNILPTREVDALGLRGGVPIAMLKALERNRREIVDDGRIGHYERLLQQSSDQRSAVALERRTRERIARETVVADSAWADMAASIAASQTEGQP